MTAKRILDVVLASVAIVVLSPVMLVTATAVLAGMGRPILFRQTRPGLGAHPFVLLKFRTMRPQTGGAGDAERLTGVGRFLRRTSLDELPQLFNVLAGDMSLVGPRPLLMEYVDRFTPEQARRFEVRPGVTGLAQVRGRNRQTWPERLALDVWYVDHRSMGLDLRILGITMWRVLTMHGVAAEGHATMPEFRGDEEAGPGG
jgi:lipopolysaccharide/colanic/teichoic acid biosynthesis glycosyltransferase